MKILNYKPEVGDVIAFSGRGFVSWFIRFCTLSPYSHVGIVGYLRPLRIDEMRLDQDSNIPVMYESTTLGEMPCLVTGKKVSGVQAQPIVERVCDYLDAGGRAWAVPLSRNARYRLNWHNEIRMSEYLVSLCGQEYDTSAALISGTRFVKFLNRLFPESMNETFCSALVHSALEVANVFPLDNSEMYSPKKLIRFGISRGVFQKPIELTL